MAHFAEIDENNIVIRVVMLDEESLSLGSRWVKTSYTGSIRKNYAGIGFTYDAGRDAFIPPKPYASWTLDENTCQWSQSIPMPTDGQVYKWNENLLAWELI